VNPLSRLTATAPPEGEPLSRSPIAFPLRGRWPTNGRPEEVSFSAIFTLYNSPETCYNPCIRGRAEPDWRETMLALAPRSQRRASGDGRSSRGTGTLSHPLYREPCVWWKRGQDTDSRSPGSETGFPAIGARYAQEWPDMHGQAEWYRETSRFVFAFLQGRSVFLFRAKARPPFPCEKLFIVPTTMKEDTTHGIQALQPGRNRAEMAKALG